ncbi:MAG: phenylalanine--tRNA ligase subunit beta [Candidatus Amoebophilus sp. 36-38]|nr:MAG: phenylalanine--tRNA ligase subunit beta [Candidatus Amoebophilus sp. 36-38]
MKLSINWLKEYISLSETPEEISKLLTQSGLEVSHIQSFEPIPGNLASMLIGQIIGCTKHPNADKLHLTQVDIGTANPLSIVCGAPNVAIGQKVVVAPVGTTLHTYTGEQIHIKAAKIRGEASEGMLCAEDEIGLGPNHEKILALDTPLPPGTPAKDYFNLQPDTILTIDLTPNRIDACSHIGVARELRALLDRPIQYPPLLAKLTPTTGLLPIQVVVDDVDACPRYSGITIAGVQVQESPRWLQYKLKSIGLNPINNIVDITNLVMYELGQPLHAFDYDKLVGKEIHVRRSQKEEKIITLDNIHRELTGQELVIADKNNNIALAGILGGKATSVSTETKNIFLESAYFSPQTIRNAAKHHKIQTDAAFRYERGVDPNLTVVALQRACLLIEEITGGKIASALIDSYPRPIESLRIHVAYEKIQQVIGQYIPKETIHHILHNLDIDTINEDEAGFTAVVPPYRVDVNREVDLVEEILRIYGYDNIQLQDHLSSTFLATTTPSSSYKLTQSLSAILVANGYQEIYTNSLTTDQYRDISEHTIQNGETIKLLNPLSDRLNMLRDKLVFSGLEVLAHNINRKQFDLKLFEFGKTYHHINTQYIERNKLGIWLTGNIEPLNWIRPPRAVTFQDLNTMLSKLLEKCGIHHFNTVPLKSSSYKAGIQLVYQTKVFATIGQVTDKYLEIAGITQPVLFADIDLDQLNTYSIPTPYYQPISKFPVVKRDLSLVVDSTIAFEDIKNILLEKHEPRIQHMHVFDVYQGANLPEGKKAYALSFALQDQEKTLDEKTIHQVMSDLIHTFQQKLGAIIRE